MRWSNSLRPIVLITGVMLMFAWAGYNARSQTIGGSVLTLSQMNSTLTNYATNAALAATTGASAQIATNTAGLAQWTYPSPCTAASKFWAQPVTAVTSININVWNLGAPSGGVQSFQVAVQNVTLVSLLGLSILAVPANPGVQTLNVFCQ